MPRFRHCALAVVAVLSLSCCCALASDIPQIAKKDGRYALLVDGAPFLILGAQVNNSSAWPSTLPDVWRAIDSLHANTVEVPVYWEQLEPSQGQFDFSVVDILLQQAREHHVRLVILWFGTWKNAAMNYTPEWIKTDPVKYPRMIDAKGEPMTILSPFGTNTLEADKKAFSALMRHLKQVDGDQHTVILVQVENEVGSYGTVRDFSALAQKALNAPVPSDLSRKLNKKNGSWQQLFGIDADEIFETYAIAHYVDRVTAAGKAEYPLPMYVNSALRDPEDSNANPGSHYPSGGPSYNVIEVWKAAAPHIDFLSPDIYLPTDEKYRKTLALYHRPDNALFVPESTNKSSFAKYFFAALNEGTIGFSPFGMDFTGYVNAPLGATEIDAKTLYPYAESYMLLESMQREIAQLNFNGKLKAAAEKRGQPKETLDFGKWQATVSYGLEQFGFGNNPPGNPDADGRAVVAQLGDNEFLVTGIDARVSFALAPSDKAQHMQFLRVEEGRYENGKWQFMRLWNGDQTDWGLNFKHVPHVLRVTLMTF